MARPRSGAIQTRLCGGVADATPLFAALGDFNRLGIIKRLCDEGPLPIAKLASGTPITRQAVTKHLHALESAGLVRSSGTGRGSVWEIRTRRLAELRRYLEQISEEWDQALQRLKTIVES